MRAGMYKPPNGINQQELGKTQPVCRDALVKFFCGMQATKLFGFVWLGFPFKWQFSRWIWWSIVRFLGTVQNIGLCEIVGGQSCVCVCAGSLKSSDQSQLLNNCVHFLKLSSEGYASFSDPHVAKGNLSCAEISVLPPNVLENVSVDSNLTWRSGGPVWKANWCGTSWECLCWPGLRFHGAQCLFFLYICWAT